MPEDPNTQATNKALVQASFDRWRNGTGGPFELLDPDAEWTIVGSSPLSNTYRRKEFLEDVIAPFNARMAKPVTPTVRGIHADGNTVIMLFDGAGTAKDGKPYRNTYAWFFQMADGKVIKATAFLDTRWLDELWTRVAPS
jgi:ketosteroid isomerase-like protein